MQFLWMPLVLALLAAQDEPKTRSSLERKLHEINQEEARHWEMFLDSKRKTQAKLIDRPVYLWTNPTKGGGQFGSVFVWAHEGRPMVVGSIFAHPTGERRRLVHEFHTLAPTVIAPNCTDGDGQTWEPKAGITLEKVPGAPAVEATAAKRLLQMRSLGRQFGGYTVDWRKQRWELRLLPQPLYRYEKPQGDILDGALLALVTDAGPDPEVLVLMEARRYDAWRYALLRFSDSSLYVQHNGKDVWSAARGPENQQNFNTDHTYRVFQKRFLDELSQTKESPAP